MTAIAIVNTINSVVDLVQKFLPLIHKDNSGLVDQVIDTLQSVAPLAIDQAEVTYTGFKNILAAVQHKATTAEQLAALKELNKRVDDKWNAIERQLDPDA